MKKQLVLLLATGILFLIFQSFRPEPPSEIGFPDEISTILKSSCYDCHSTANGSEKPLKALDFEKWNEYRLTKQIGLLGDIGKMVEEGKMPPGSTWKISLIVSCRKCRKSYWPIGPSWRPIN